MIDLAFVLNSLLLGVGLSMDAFSVSLANGLNDSDIKMKKTCGIAGMFAFFQALMPMTGWLCVHTVVQYFQAFERFIPWIALILLCDIGGKMLVEGIKCTDDECECGKLTFGTLLVQGIATSIDALSVGFTIAEYDFYSACLSALLIALVTFVICTLGVIIGKKAGTKLSGKAGILGGAILIFIGIEIFVKGVF